MQVKNIIPPTPLIPIINPLLGPPPLLFPQLNNTTGRILTRKHALLVGLDTHPRIHVRIISRREPRNDRLDKSLEIIRIRNPRRPESLARKEELAVGSMDAICDTLGHLPLHDLADNGAEEGFEQPAEDAELGFAQLVRELVNMYTYGLEGKNLFQLLLADFDVEVDVDAALVQLEGCNALVGETEKTRMCAEEEADFVSTERETVNLDGELGCGL